MTTPHLGEAGTHPVVASTARELLNKSDNERSSVLSTAMSFLGLYRDPVAAQGNHSTWAAYDDGYLNRSGSWRCISRRFLSSSTPSLVKAMMASSPIP